MIPRSNEAPFGFPFREIMSGTREIQARGQRSGVGKLRETSIPEMMDSAISFIERSLNISVN